MAKTKKKPQKMRDIFDIVMMYLSFFIANSVVLYTFHLLFPRFVVFGTQYISPLAAVIQSMLMFSLIVVSFTPFIEFIEYRRKITLKDHHWVILYFIINAAVLWVIARLANRLGLGISSWVVVVVLALLLDLIQGITIKLFSQKK